MEEIWKDITGYEGYYQISNLGRVKGLDRIVKNRFFPSKIMKKSDNKGYKMAHLSKDSIGKLFLIHRLVAKAFIPNPNNFPDVNHKDTNKSNNNVNNLEWTTEKSNTQHAIQNGKMDYLFGENNFKSQLTLDQVKDIRNIYWQSKQNTANFWSEKYNVSKSCILSIISNSNWFDEDYQKFLDKNNENGYGRNFGTKNGAVKLTENQVKEIREIRRTTDLSLKDIGELFSISGSGVEKIVKLKTWKNI